MRRKRLTLAFVLAAAIAPAGTALAQPACSPPSDLAPAASRPPPANEVQKGVVTAYYLLSLNWTPEWCRTNGQGITAQKMECGHPFGFTLHGLWPDGAAPPYPRYCNRVGRLDAAMVKRMYCRTPSPELLQHEWAAHGSCGWTRSEAYFGQASTLYDRIVMPRIETIAPDALTAGAVRQAFTARNPWLDKDAVYVQLDHSQRLTEVRICYDLKYKATACQGGNGAPDQAHIRLTPSLTRAF
jgi:ribonuclease T2